MKKFLSLILLFVAIGLHAQIAIKGTVTSGDDGSALPGVSVVIKGTLLQVSLQTLMVPILLTFPIWMLSLYSLS